MFHYRLNITGQFRWVSMELFRSSEYTDTNQMIILYVRDINDEYLKQLDVIMRRATDALGMVSLNITKGICIAGSVRKHYLQLQEGMERIEDYILRISENLVEKEKR
ncbi:hypothetical protein [Anaerostipes sp.]|uniref:hypothetical protein n=1 Tax=Anaerostipes sp. TaxID=1872530 RepID=UPI003FF06ACB